MSGERLYLENQLSSINFFDCFGTITAVLRNSTHPEFISLLYVRNNMRLMGIFPREHSKESLAYKLYNMAIIGCLLIFIISIACDLFEASNDFVVFGDDLVVLLGLVLIFVKILLQRKRSDEIDQIIYKFDELHRKFARWPRETLKIQACQRVFFLGESITCLVYMCVAVFFCLAILAQPLVAPQPLPFRSKYPFNWHDPQQHPIMHALIYVFQFICCFFNLIAIIFVDQSGCHLISQTTVNLRIICISLRDLGRDEISNNMLDQLHDIIKFHQHILDVAQKIMNIFYWNYVAQMGASTFIICLTAYETLLVQDQPMVALKFLTYMLTSFSQIFYWCLMGNMVYYDSLDVATAGFEVQNWYKQPKAFQQDLMFLIQSAQKPLIFRAKPLFGFTFQSFTSILSSSYSYFTLLRTMNEN